MSDRVQPDYPWREHVRCDGCGRGYIADYTQDRDWSRCPNCTGEAGKAAKRIFDPKTWTWQPVMGQQKFR